MIKKIYQAVFLLFVPLLLFCTSCVERRNGYQVVGLWEGEGFEVKYRDTTLTLSPRFIFVPDRNDAERGEVEVRGTYDMFTPETNSVYATHAQGDFLIRGEWYATKDGVQLMFRTDDAKASMNEISLVGAPSERAQIYKVANSENRQTKVQTSKTVVAFLEEFLEDENEEAEIQFKEGDRMAVMWNSSDWLLYRD